MEAIIRQTYIDKIEKYLGKETIVVIVGQRRVGKSYMLRQLVELKSKDLANNIIYIDKITCLPLDNPKIGDCKSTSTISLFIF